MMTSILCQSFTDSVDHEVMLERPMDLGQFTVLHSGIGPGALATGDIVPIGFKAS